jgi:membrane-bound lytic murein transglycosylase A
MSTAERAEAMGRACSALDRLPESPDLNAARAFFETAFSAYRVVLSDGEGLLTAYYEPVIEGSRTRSEQFSVPLRARPENYVAINDDNRPIGFDADLTAARRTDDGLEPLPTRREIDAGALDEVAEPLVWVADPVDAFFVHIQGSTRIALAGGDTMRVGFAGRNGHPYTSVGEVMMERGLRPEGGFSMDGMRAFFGDNPQLARELMHENRSYIFFHEVEALDDQLGPIGAQGVPLTAQRSLAVDRDFHRLGTPIFIDARLPTGPERRERPFQKLMVAQDVGSAIKGPARGDLFWGTGEEAGSIAGGIKSPASFYLLLPRSGTWSGA